MNSKTKKAITIKDIAEEAGVSKATVSLALNNNPKVATKTAKKIIKIANEKNYNPNVFAKRLSTGKSRIITLFLLGESGNYSEWVVSSSWMVYNSILKGLSTILSKNNYELQLEFIDINTQDYKKIINKTITTRNTGGILMFIKTSSLDYTFLKKSFDYNVPIITLNKKIAVNLNSIEINNYIGAYNAVDYLVGLGHKKIAHIKGPKDSFNAQDRMKGYLDAMKDNNLKIDENYTILGDWAIESGEKKMEKLLQLSSPPSAVFCANDYIAAGAINRINDFNFKVPEDISVIGFDDSIISRVINPKLTSVHLPLLELGRLAAKEMIGFIEEDNRQKNNNSHHILAPNLVVRDSCASVNL